MKAKQFKDFNVLDIGNKYEIEGVVYGRAGQPGDGGETVIIMLPGESFNTNTTLILPTLEEWQKVIRQSDLKEVEVTSGDKKAKIVLRKSTRQIETKIMWEVFRRDGYVCRYCSADDVPMTIDHIVLWEEGGPSIPDNLLCTCKKCNNARGNMQYEDWIQSDEYLKKLPDEIGVPMHIKNSNEVLKIPNIRANHMRVHKRSR